MTVKSTTIIAEIGVNHNGSMELAKKMIVAAKEIGADYAKFQSFSSSKLLIPTATKAEYQVRTTPKNESALQMLQALELSENQQKELFNYCLSTKMQFLSSPFDLDSLDFLIKLGCPVIKIPSGEITNLPLLRLAGQKSQELILSTGMSSLGDIENAMEVLTRTGLSEDKIILLQCTSEYPTPAEDIHLRALETIKQAFGTRVGLSDHTPGIHIAIAAVALGAELIEKHFTLDKNMVGPDHKASLEPKEFQSMVHCIREIEKALGTAQKKARPSEIKNQKTARKSLVAATNIKRGETFTSTNLTCKRPALGLSPMTWDYVIGQKAVRDFAVDEYIELEKISTNL